MVALAVHGGLRSLPEAWPRARPGCAAPCARRPAQASLPRPLRSGSVGPTSLGRPRPPPLHSQSPERSAVPPERPRGLGDRRRPLAQGEAKCTCPAHLNLRNTLTGSPTDHALGCRKNSPAVTHYTFKSQSLSGYGAANFRYFLCGER